MDALKLLKEDHQRVNPFTTVYWLNNEQIRLVTHKLYSNKIYYEIFIPLINRDYHEERTIEDILTYLDNIQLEQEQVIDVQDMKTKLTILP